MSNPKQHVILCECFAAQHQVIFRYWPDDEDIDKALYMDVYLSTYKNFWRRLKTGIKYIFGKKSDYGEFDNSLLDKEKAIGLNNFLTEFIASYKE